MDGFSYELLGVICWRKEPVDMEYIIASLSDSDPPPEHPITYDLVGRGIAILAQAGLVRMLNAHFCVATAHGRLLCERSMEQQEKTFMMKDIPFIPKIAPHTRRPGA